MALLRLSVIAIIALAPVANLALSAVSADGPIPAARVQKAVQQANKGTHADLRAELPSERWPGIVVLATVRVHQLAELDEVEGKALQSGTLRTGVIRSFPAPLDPLAEGRTFSAGGHTVLVMIVGSPRASAVRVRVDALNAPSGARLYIHNGVAGSEILGPYEARGPFDGGPFWSPPVAGDRAVLEYVEPQSSNALERRPRPFVVSQVGHQFLDRTRTSALRAVQHRASIRVFGPIGSSAPEGVR